MRPRKLAVALAGVIGVAALRRYRDARRGRERVDLYFRDGSMVSLRKDLPEAQRLLPLAHDVLRSARG